MKSRLNLAVTISLLAVANASAATHYVSLESTNPTPPYTTWATAATNIQAAVNVSASRDVIVVSNGTYAGGISVTIRLTLRSVNGPNFTLIDGRRTNQCVRNLTVDASLTGFTLTNGQRGVFCPSTNAFLTNCVIVGNSPYGGASRGTLYNCTLAGNSNSVDGIYGGEGGGAKGSRLHNCTLTNNWAVVGGGAYSCTLHNCTLTANSADRGGGGASASTLYNCVLSGNWLRYDGSGGGASGSTLYNCTLTGNSANKDGGVYGCRLYNCIAYFNTASTEANYDPSSRLTNCCTVPRPTTGVGNIALDPQLASASHLSAGSPCRGAGSRTWASGTDIDGEVWGNPPAIGCDEFHAGAMTGPLAVGVTANYTNVAVGYPVSLTALIEGRLTHSVWEFGDGTMATNKPYIVHTWTQPGEYLVTLCAFNESHVQGVCASITIHVLAHPVVYVSSLSPNPQPPYISWATAATNIQDAVDAPLLGYSVVVVSNGAYAGGVRVTKRLTLLSVNGPTFTLINGQGANQCVNLTDGASLTGFTITNGQSGVYCASQGAFLTNCVIVGNSPSGGAYRGTLYNCTLTNNRAYEGGGAYLCTLHNCTLTANSADYTGGGAFQCTLYNCALSGNSLRYDGSGGGANGSTLYNCTLTGNSAAWGGGVSGSELHNCTLTGNLAADEGGGASGCWLYNCTLIGNSAAWGGGVSGSRVYNCIVYFNAASDAANYDPESTLDYCCTIPLPTTNGAGNIALDPQLASASHLSAGSPCRGAGSGVWASGTDIDGEGWGNPPSIGCDEVHAGAVTGPLAVTLTANYTNVAVDYPVSLTAPIEGRLTHSVWAFGDGTMATNQPCIVHTWRQPGDYLATLCAFNESHLAGVCASITIHVPAHPVVYVSSSATNPQPPYVSWATAATAIQDALDVPQLGYSIVVSNGVYSGDVTVTNPQMLVSANGPEVTVIDGGGNTFCVFLGDGASLTGFTLTNGVGGVYCSSTNAFLTNCVIVGNSAAFSYWSGAYGAGAYQGTLHDCTLTSNSAAGVWVGSWEWGEYYPGAGGGAYGSTLYHCTLSANSATDWGGGVCQCTLYSCTLTGNSARGDYDYYDGGQCGGGAAWSTLYNCTLTGNSADDLGGGAANCILYNCTLTGNSGLGATGGALYNCTVTGNAGGVAGAALYNSILYFNAAAGAANYDTNTTLNYCCTTPLPTNGVGNISNAPLFIDYAGGNLRLQSNSPGVNAGNSGYLTNYDESWGLWFTNEFDLDGRPRLVGASVDMGAYEFQAGMSGAFIAWLQQYGLPTDGSADYADADTDRMNNWQEWICGTCPTNPASALCLLSATPTATKVTVTWQSVAGVNYFLERSPNLASPFALLATNILGQAGTTSYTDPNAVRPGPFFYRVGVMCP